MSSLYLTSTLAPPKYRALLLKGLLVLGCVLLVLRLSQGSDAHSVTGLHSNRAAKTTPFPVWLDENMGMESNATHLVLTSADSQWIDQATAALQLSISSFNQLRKSQGRENMEIVVLTADAGAQAKCRAKGWKCYSGFARTGPSSMTGGTREWLKVAGITEALLAGRDTLFVESDVSLMRDPLAALEPLLGSADLIANEMPPGALNTGLMWTRATNMSAEMWTTVRRRALAGETKVQDVLNELLGTSGRLLRADGSSADSFVSANGLEVHVLDHRFRASNLIYDRPVVDVSDAISLQLSCAGNIQNRLFAAQMLGAYPNLDSYYTSLHPILKIDTLSGTRAEVVQQFKILLTAARYSARSLEVPSSCYFTDIERTRPMYSCFPVSRLGKILGVPILEPGYTLHALRHISARSSSDPTADTSSEQTREEDAEDQIILADGEGVVAEVEAQELTVEEENEEMAPDTALLAASELDLRNCDSLPDLLHRLISHAYRSESVLTFTNFKTAPNWRRWALPSALDEVTTCEDLDKSLNCANICKRSSEAALRKVKWPSLSEVMVEPGEWLSEGNS